MRAFYLKNLTLQDSYLLKSEEAHHLIHVVRIQVDEELLLLNGEGLVVKTKVHSIDRRELVLLPMSHQQFENEAKLDIALGIPKKDALELCLKQLVELSIGKVYLIRSDFSQIKIPERDRIEALMISALEQSNAPQLPDLQSLSWDQIPFQDYAGVWLMDSRPQSFQSGLMPSGRQLLIIGPEGGFSPRELALFQEVKGLKPIHLPTGILRTPTALATGTGFILGRLLN